MIQTIGGDVVLSATKIAQINWPQLTSIGGQLALISTGDLTTIDMIRLTSIGGPVQISLDPNVTRVDMRALRTVAGFFNLIQSPKVNTARFDAVQTVNGTVNLSDLMWISYSAVQRLWEAGNRTEPPQYVGCCISGIGITQSNCMGVNIFSQECM